MAFSRVTGQHAYASAVGPVSSLVLTLPANPTPGNLVVIGALWQDGVHPSSVVTSIQDANGNVYAQATNSPESTNGVTCGATYLFYLLVAPANAHKTITITWATSGSFTSGFIDEFTATSLPAIADLSTKGNGTSGTITLPTVTRTGANELLVLYGTHANAVTAANAPWVAAETLPTALGDCLAYVLDSSSDVAANLTCGTVDTWDAVAQSFRMTAAGAAAKKGSSLLSVGVGN